MTRIPFLRLVGCWLLLQGLVARLSPLVDPVDRLPWQYLSEDGYLMQTIARNIALGLGMTTSEGTIATNGVQPLATYLFAALHVLAGGDKTTALVLVSLLSAALAGLACGWMYLLMRRLFAAQDEGGTIALLTASVWFAAPLITRHGMNGLETGLYHAALLGVLWGYVRLVQGGGANAWTTRQRLGFGAALGVVFLVRNDAVFFIGALLAAHVAVGGTGRGRRLVDAAVAGAVSLLVAAPWLVNNFVRFGSIVPISGSAQLGTRKVLGGNLDIVPANLFENTLVFAPLPGSLESRAVVAALCLLVVAGVWTLWWRLVARDSMLLRRLTLGWLIFAAAFFGYYGIYFGAKWFVPRYLSPLSVLMWPMAVMAGVMAWRRWLSARTAAGPRVAAAAGVVIAAMCGVQAAQQFRDGRQHMHRQVVEWVRAHVSPERWVGAVQTGTLGYFHDRTINLDGKVNPQALRVLRRDGHVLEYVVDSRIEVIADWVGVADWVGRGPSERFSSAFQVRVRDPSLNLSVLERVEPVRRP